MRLVENWRAFWRWHSVQILAALTVLPVVWVELPPDVKAMVPADWRPWIVSALALAGIVGRVRSQGDE